MTQDKNFIINRLQEFNHYYQYIKDYINQPIQEGSGFEENIILSNYKMPKKSKKNAQAIHQEMFGTGMDEDEMSDMEGDGISEWMSNLSKLFKLLKIRATM
jgi:hypothetical protein